MPRSKMYAGALSVWLYGYVGSARDRCRCFPPRDAFRAPAGGKRRAGPPQGTARPPTRTAPSRRARRGPHIFPSGPPRTRRSRTRTEEAEAAPRRLAIACAREQQTSRRDSRSSAPTWAQVIARRDRESVIAPTCVLLSLSIAARTCARYETTAAAANAFRRGACTRGCRRRDLRASADRWLRRGRLRLAACRRPRSFLAIGRA
jgi:hypothetical protein